MKHVPFTPGPWEIKEGSNSGHCCFSHSIVKDDFNICELIGNTSDDDETNKANAHIIVKAPALLAELELALTVQDMQDSEEGMDADFVDDWKRRASELIKEIRG